MIFFLACVPHTMLWYDTLPLLLVAKTFRESLILSFMSWVPLTAQLATGEFVPMNITQYILYGFVPSLILVLLRPNTAPDRKLDNHAGSSPSFGRLSRMMSAGKQANAVHS